jgi:hypothetical protein
MHPEWFLLKQISMETDTQWHFYRKLSQTQNVDMKSMIGNTWNRTGFKEMAALYSRLRTYNTDTHGSSKPDLLPESTKTI